MILLLFYVGTPVTFPDGHKSFEKEVVIDETKRNRKGGVQMRDKQDSLKIAWEAEHDKTT